MCQSATDSNADKGSEKRNHGLAEVGVVIGGVQSKDEEGKNVDGYSSQFESEKQSIIDIAMEGDEVGVVSDKEVTIDVQEEIKEDLDGVREELKIEQMLYKEVKESIR